MDGVADGTSEGHVDGLLLGSRVGSSYCVVVLGAEEGAADGDKDILGTIEGDKEGFWLGNADGEDQLRNSRSALMVFPYTSKLLQHCNICCFTVSYYGKRSFPTHAIRCNEGYIVIHIRAIKGTEGRISCLIRWFARFHILH